MLECPKCKSTNINQYRMTIGLIWCEECKYRVEEKEKYNPFVVDSFEDTVKEATKKLNQGMRIEQMQDIRASNNDNWMDLLRLALKHAPQETKKILQKITNKDKEISGICEKIINDK